VSSRHTRSFFGVMLAVVFALSAVVVAPASAKLSKHQKAHIRKQLKRAIKKNPKLIRSKSFIKKASLVNFTLPVTIKLRSTGTPSTTTALGNGTGSNPNYATLNLGASLGQREVDLGGSLAAEIQFHDSYDGGALGNVDLRIDDSTTKMLTSTSIPLLWNTDVSNGNVPSALKTWDTGLATNNAMTGGCSTFQGGSNLNWDPTNLALLLASNDPFANQIGVPVFTSGGAPSGSYVPVSPGIDDITNLTASNAPGNLNNLGGQLDPFPSPTPAQSDPGGFPAVPSVRDTVLRTAPLKLGVATEGTEVPQDTGAGVNGSQNLVIGKSGGQANLFGHIPGKSYGVDVTVSLQTQINSILRAVDVDAQHIVQGSPWPAALFDCRQAFTGSVQNYIPDVRLKGDLKISPAITPTGDLRIAKVSLSSLSEPVPTHFAVAACLSPYSVLAKEQNNTNTATYNVPATASPPLYANSELPADTSSYARVGSAQNPDFSAAGTCNQKDGNHPTQLVKDTLFSGLNAVGNADGFSSFAQSSDGSKVSVAADLTVNRVEADVLIGNR
jgi:hypothetical protein